MATCTVPTRRSLSLSSRKRALAVETLESRFNLSGLGGLSLPAEALQLSRLAKTQTSTLKTKPQAVSLGATTALDTTSLFGDTSVSSNATTTVNVTDYSSIANARIEYQNGTPDIGYMASSGVNIEYKLNVGASGDYKLNFGVATPSSFGAFDLYVNGNKATTFDFLGTGSWSSWANSARTVHLDAGTATIKITPIWGSVFNIRDITLSPSNVSTTTTTPSTTPTTPPTTTSSSTSTWVGSSATITADKYSAISGSKLEYINGTPDIGYVSTSGAYVEYTLNVGSAGNYNVSVNTAAPGYATYDLLVNGGQSANYETGGTGSWSNFSPISKSVYLNAGKNVIRFASKWGTQYNIGTINISQGSTSTNTTTPSTPTTTTPSTPQASDSWTSGASVAVSSSWMTSFNQLNIVGSSSSDSIYLSQSGDTLTLVADGKTTTYSASGYGDIYINAGDGNDSVTVDSSVNRSVRVYGAGGNDTLTNKTSGKGTIVSIGGGSDVVVGNGWSTSIWADSSDSVSGASGNKLHSVSGFWGGVSTELQGQNLNDPSATGSTTRLNSSSFWGTGPVKEDVTQGQSSDCYLLGPLQTLAYTNPDRLRELAVDLGDGTYAIQFKRGGNTTYVRVDGDLPAGGWYQQGINYSHPGASGNQWMPIIEKAYAEFRTGAWSYGSLDWGNFNSVLSDFGISATGIGGDANTLYNSIAGNVSKGVTIGTNSGINSGAPLIGSHTYTVINAWRDGSGTGYLTLRNPWGYDGAGSDSNGSDGLVTLSMYQLQSNMQMGSIVV